MSKLPQRLGLFFLVFGIPFLLIYFLATGKPKYKELPYMGSPIVKTPGDTSYPTVNDFHYINSKGEPINKSTLKNKVLLWNTLFTTCPAECPILLSQVKKFLYEDFISDRRFREHVVIVSHIVNSDGTIPNIKPFVEAQGEIDSNWVFVTGLDSSIYDFTFANGKNLWKDNHDIAANIVGGKSLYSLILLIDPDHHVRRLYRGNKTQDIKRALDEIRLLLKEYDVK